MSKGATKLARVGNGLRRLARTFGPFKSQKGQDWWVLRSVHQFKRGGFFLDVGAADGKTFSNTRVLEKLFGWSGMCIEPNPELFSRLSADRGCLLDESVISDKREDVRFRTDNGQLGGIVAEDTDNNFAVRGDELRAATVVPLQALTLNEVLDRHSAPRAIDYFSLDVEGSEERVIRGLDFERYRFGCLTIERPTPRVNEILLRNDYVFVKNRLFDSFYVHPDLASTRQIQCHAFEQVPPKTW